MYPSKVGDVIARCDRNSGESSGLEHPYLNGSIGPRYMVWNRHTGVICYVTRQRTDERWEGFAEHRARDKSDQLNAWHAGYKDGRLPVDFAAIDSTP